MLVTLHWGFEGDLLPRQNQLDLAAAMIEAGADAIFGHHAHRLQPLELVDGVPAAWGLGHPGHRPRDRRDVVPTGDEHRVSIG